MKRVTIPMNVYERRMEMAKVFDIKSTPKAFLLFDEVVGKLIKEKKPNGKRRKTKIEMEFDFKQ